MLKKLLLFVDYNSTYATNLLVYKLIKSIENTGGDASWTNRNNERQNRITNNMFREGILDSNQLEKKGVVDQKHGINYIDEYNTVY